jgi:hypothetical protein
MGLAVHRSTVLLGTAPLQTSKPYWTLVQTSWRGMRMADPKQTSVVVRENTEVSTKPQYGHRLILRALA